MSINSQEDPFGSLEELKEEPTNKKGMWSTKMSIILPLASYLLIAILGNIVFLIIAFSLGISDIQAMTSSPLFFIVSILLELVFILVPVVYIKKFLREPTVKARLDLLGFTTKDIHLKGISKEIIIGLIFGIASLFIVNVVTFFTQILIELLFPVSIETVSPGPSVDYIRPQSLFFLILTVILMFLVVAPSEEILFRGFMQQGLVSNLGQKTGVYLSALIFSLIHLTGIFLQTNQAPLSLLASFILSFVPYFTISFILGKVFEWRDENLISVIIIHGLYNAAIFILLFFYF